MPRGKALGREQWLSILLAGVVGFLVGDWHSTHSRPSGLSASEKVALRFPVAYADEATSSDAAADAPASAMVVGGAQLALLNPQPMMPVRYEAAPLAPLEIAEEESPEPPLPAAPVYQAAPAAKPEVNSMAATQPAAELKPGAENAARRASRPGFLLNDAQIASIKSRLHLTPDQERMWPAVEAALRNIAYAKAHRHRRGTQGNSAEVAALDPDSAEVQGLKSAAVPLIMSFSDQQKSEVRNLAHVLGLDKLASHF